MNDQNEIIEIYNDDYSLAGTMSRGQAQKESRWVRVSHLWVINLKTNTVLFQRRSNSKKLFPGKLDITAAGHYAAGDGLEKGVLEMSQELGVEISFSGLISLGIRHNIIPTPELTVRQFCHVFFFASDRNAADYSLNPEISEGLLSIPIEDGLKLWSGAASTIEASFFEAKTTEKLDIIISKNDFLPRVDPYYYKVFVLARRFLAGEKHLVI
jgi:isopentenyldiphosphate isomerase